jgi:hypothetical protein
MNKMRNPYNHSIYRVKTPFLVQLIIKKPGFRPAPTLLRVLY